MSWQQMKKTGYGVSSHYQGYEINYWGYICRSCRYCDLLLTVEDGKCWIVQSRSCISLIVTLFQVSAARSYSPLTSGGGKFCFLNPLIDNKPFIVTSSRFTSLWLTWTNWTFSSLILLSRVHLHKNLKRKYGKNFKFSEVLNFSFQFHQIHLRTVWAVKLPPTACPWSQHL